MCISVVSVYFYCDLLLEIHVTGRHHFSRSCLSPRGTRPPSYSDAPNCRAPSFFPPLIRCGRVRADFVKAKHRLAGSKHLGTRTCKRFGHLTCSVARTPGVRRRRGEGRRRRNAAGALGHPPSDNDPDTEMPPVVVETTSQGTRTSPYPTLRIPSVC